MSNVTEKYFDPNTFSWAIKWGRDSNESSFTVKAPLVLLCELPISCDKKGNWIQDNQAHLIFHLSEAELAHIPGLLTLNVCSSAVCKAFVATGLAVTRYWHSQLLKSVATFLNPFRWSQSHAAIGFMQKTKDVSLSCLHGLLGTWLQNQAMWTNKVLFCLCRSMKSVGPLLF